ncbi:MAG: hypothetical protein RL091_2151, partial [Verrucomicrobiota bacterium]
MQLYPTYPKRLRGLLLVTALVPIALPSIHAFVFGQGDLKGSFDTTVSVGSLYRINDPDPQFYGLTAGGQQ